MTSRALTILIKGQFRKILRNRFQARRKTRRAINNPNANFDIQSKSDYFVQFFTWIIRQNNPIRQINPITRKKAIIIDINLYICTNSLN